MDKMVPVPSHSIIPERDLSSKTILEVHRLGIDFGGLHAVEDFSIMLGRTETSGLIGPNGAGKTTTLKSAAGILQFDAGEIYIDGKSIRTQPLECKRSFAYTGTVQSCGNTPKRLR